MKRFAIALLPLLLVGSICSSCSQARPSQKAVSHKVPATTDATFAEQVLHAKGPVLVDFWAPWCGPCKMLAPTVAELSREFNGKLKVYELNVDENPKTPNSYKIHSIPCLMLFKNGKMVDKSVGYRQKAGLVEMIKKNLP